MKQTIKKILPYFIKEPLLEYNRQKFSSNRYKNEELNNPGDYYSLKSFDYYKCIFVHVPKTAGVSVNKTLFGNLGGGHKSIKEYQAMYLPSTYKKYFKFTIIRNPYDRLYSAYNFLKQGGFEEADKKWVDENLNHINSYEQFVKEWVNTENIYKKNHFTPQFEYLIDNKNQLGVDFVGRLENIENDFKTICRKLGIKRELIHVNKSIKMKNISIDNEMKTIIDKVYFKDFDLFNY